MNAHGEGNSHWRNGGSPKKKGPLTGLCNAKQGGGIGVQN